MTVSTEALAKLLGLASKATPGPWGWYGYRKREYALATSLWGHRWVMRFVRLGMQGSQPQFQTYESREAASPLYWRGLMQNADEIAVQEVTYRGDIIGIDNDDARYIAAVDPTTVLALIHEVEMLRAENEDLQGRVDRLGRLVVPDSEMAAAIDAVRKAHE